MEEQDIINGRASQLVMAAVLKTVEAQALAGSTPVPSANCMEDRI